MLLTPQYFPLLHAEALWVTSHSATPPLPTPPSSHHHAPSLESLGATRTKPLPAHPASLPRVQLYLSL
ncbi:hypothetical protein E2C01_098618 [Portunus trituberculatus]|uniref:Uncharacterized protein n=1 Tax=Portunus trituberculatus TaxID=210409 RepID=A0A5B7KEL7_PORTR|nr:hypothetical protein [Portunus trituberculatus]